MTISEIDKQIESARKNHENAKRAASLAHASWMSAVSMNERSRAILRNLMDERRRLVSEATAV